MMPTSAAMWSAQERTALGTLERAKELVAFHTTAVTAIQRRVDAATAAELQVRLSCTHLHD